MRLTRRQKWGLALLGLALVVLSIALLAYAFWPLPDAMDAVPVSPTLFAPPG